MALVSWFKIFVLTIIIFISSIFILNGQIGITANYHLENLDQANNIGQTAIFPKKIGIVSAGVNYWFSLKNYRAEFYPGLHYSHSIYPNSYQITENAIQLELPIHFFYLILKTNAIVLLSAKKMAGSKKVFLLN